MKFAILGNAVVDGFAQVRDDVLVAHKLAKRGYNKMTPAAFFALCADVAVEKYEPGGTAANVAYTLGKLGEKVGFLGRFGADAAGQVFFDDMVAAGVSTAAPDSSAKTMEVFVLVTPDGQRTLATLGTTARMRDAWIREEEIKAADWLLIEGYLLADQLEVVAFALKVAQAEGVKVALSLASPQVLAGSATALSELLLDEDGAARVDLIMGDTAETAALTEVLAPHKAAQQVVQTTPRITTHSGDGATFYDAQGTPTFVATQKVENPVDVTGAGDAFAAGFLRAYAAGEAPEAALTAGHTLARKVIMQLGGRLKEGF